LRSLQGRSRWARLDIRRHLDAVLRDDRGNRVDKRRSNERSLLNFVDKSMARTRTDPYRSSCLKGPRTTNDLGGACIVGNI
jgi:hypothetical protein